MQVVEVILTEKVEGASDLLLVGASIVAETVQGVVALPRLP